MGRSWRYYEEGTSSWLMSALEVDAEAGPLDRVRGRLRDIWRSTDLSITVTASLLDRRRSAAVRTACEDVAHTRNVAA